MNLTYKSMGESTDSFTDSLFIVTFVLPICHWRYPGTRIFVSGCMRFPVFLYMQIGSTLYQLNNVVFTVNLLYEKGNT